MSNLISIVEIPTINFARAVEFYQNILDLTIEEIDMDGVQMGVFPSDKDSVNVLLIKNDDYKPTNYGTLIYLNITNKLEAILEKIKLNGGQVITSKTEISPEMGFFAHFIDTEGNKIGIHSMK